MQPNRQADSHFSTRLLTIAVVLTAAAFIWLGWEEYRSHRGTATEYQQLRHLEGVRGEIIHLDEVLTMSARMAATTGDLSWEARYRRFEPQLSAVIAEAIALVPDAYTGETAVVTDAANTRLVEMENRAFDLVRQGRREQAQGILFSETYEAQKAIYARGMARLDDAIGNHAGAIRQASARRFVLDLAIVAGVSLLLAAGWFVVLRSLRRQHAQIEEDRRQITAQAGELHELSRDLEGKVAERVKELNCLYSLSGLVEQAGVTLEGILQRAVSLIPPAWHYPDATCARIRLDEQEFLSDDFAETPWKLSADIVVNGETAGGIDVCYLDEKPERDVGPFLSEERDLLSAVAERLERIVERFRMQDALVDSETRLKLALQASRTGIWESNLDTGEVRWSLSVGPLFGFPQGTVSGTREALYERFHPDDREGVRRAAARAVEENAAFEVEHRVVWPDGSVRWLAKHGKVLRDEAGRPVRMLGTVMDVTERRQAEQTLRDSEDWLKQQTRQQDALLQISRAIQGIRHPSDLERVVRAIDEALREIGLNFFSLAIHRLVDESTRTFESYEIRSSGDTGHLVRPLPNVYRMWQAAKAKYRPDLDVDAGGTSPEDVEKLRRRYGVPIRCILDMPHASGTLAVLSVQPDAFSESQRHFMQLVADTLSVGISRVEDLERRTGAVQELRKSEETFRAITGAAQDAMIMLNNEGNICYWNGAAEGVFGYPTQEVMGRELHSFLVPGRFYDAHKKAFEGFKTTGEGAAVDKTLELIGVKKDGTEFPVELSLASVKLKEAWHAVGIIRDITERKRMETAVQEREERIKAILDGSPDGIGVADNHTKRFVYVNPALCKMLGYDADELVGAGIDKIHPAEQLRYAISEFEAQARGDKSLAEGLPCLRKDGSVFYADVNTTGASVDGRTCNIGFFRDITLKKQMEEALRQTERNRVLMETAGAAAHEINQPLAVISGLAQILLGTAWDDDPHREDFREIYAGTKRIQDILTRMEKVQRYDTKSYVGSAKIVDFDRTPEDA